MFDIAKPENAKDLNIMQPTDKDASRFVRYQFSPDFLSLKTIGATCGPLLSVLFWQSFNSSILRVEFTVGNKPIKNLRMVERHYFDNKVLKSFDFNFGFCVPNSRNTVEHIYEMPALDQTECTPK